jgi:hypothetical protein
VVKIEFVPRQLRAAILAHALVPCVDIVAAKADLSFGNPVIAHQENYPGDPYNPVYQTDALIPDGDGEVTPAIEIESLVLFIYGSGDSLIKQRKSPPHRGYMDGQVGAVKDENLSVQD